MGNPNEWSKLRHAYAEYMGGPESGLPKWARIIWVALARLEPHGHVQFAPGELAECLATIDPKTGEVKVDEANVAGHVKKAIANGHIGANSTTLCIHVPLWMASRGNGRRESFCMSHGRVKAEKSY